MCGWNGYMIDSAALNFSTILHSPLNYQAKP